MDLDQTRDYIVPRSTELFPETIITGPEAVSQAEATPVVPLLDTQSIKNTKQQVEESVTDLLSELTIQPEENQSLTVTEDMGNKILPDTSETSSQIAQIISAIVRGELDEIQLDLSQPVTASQIGTESEEAAFTEQTTPAVEDTQETLMRDALPEKDSTTAKARRPQDLAVERAFLAMTTKVKEEDDLEEETGAAQLPQPVESETVVETVTTESTVEVESEEETSVSDATTVKSILPVEKEEIEIVDDEAPSFGLKRPKKVEVQEEEEATAATFIRPAADVVSAEIDLPKPEDVTEEETASEAATFSRPRQPSVQEEETSQSSSISIARTKKATEFTEQETSEVTFVRPSKPIEDENPPAEFKLPASGEQVVEEEIEETSTLFRPKKTIQEDQLEEPTAVELKRPLKKIVVETEEEDSLSEATFIRAAQPTVTVEDETVEDTTFEVTRQKKETETVEEIMSEATVQPTYTNVANEEAMEVPELLDTAEVSVPDENSTASLGAVPTIKEQANAEKTTTFDILRPKVAPQAAEDGIVSDEATEVQQEKKPVEEKPEETTIAPLELPVHVQDHVGSETAPETTLDQTIQPQEEEVAEAKFGLTRPKKPVKTVDETAADAVLVRPVKPAETMAIELLQPEETEEESVSETASFSRPLKPVQSENEEEVAESSTIGVKRPTKTPTETTVEEEVTLVRPERSESVEDVVEEETAVFTKPSTKPADDDLDIEDTSTFEIKRSRKIATENSESSTSEATFVRPMKPQDEQPETAVIKLMKPTEREKSVDEEEETVSESVSFHSAKRAEDETIERIEETSTFIRPKKVSESLEETTSDVTFTAPTKSVVEEILEETVTKAELPRPKEVVLEEIETTSNTSETTTFVKPAEEEVPTEETATFVRPAEEEVPTEETATFVRPVEEEVPTEETATFVRPAEEEVPTEETATFVRPAMPVEEEQPKEIAAVIELKRPITEQETMEKETVSESGTFIKSKSVDKELEQQETSSVALSRPKKMVAVEKEDNSTSEATFTRPIRPVEEQQPELSEETSLIAIARTNKVSETIEADQDISETTVIRRTRPQKDEQPEETSAALELLQRGVKPKEQTPEEETSVTVELTQSAQPEKVSEEETVTETTVLTQPKEEEVQSDEESFAFDVSPPIKRLDKRVKEEETVTTETTATQQERKEREQVASTVDEAPKPLYVEEIHESEETTSEASGETVVDRRDVETVSSPDEHVAVRFKPRSTPSLPESPDVSEKASLKLRPVVVESTETESTDAGASFGTLLPADQSTEESEIRLSVGRTPRKPSEEQSISEVAVEGQFLQPKQPEMPTAGSPAPDTDRDVPLESQAVEELISEPDYEHDNEDSLAEIGDNIWESSQAEDLRRTSHETIVPEMEDKRAQRRVRIEETPVIIEDSQQFTSISESRFDTEDISLSEELLELDDDEVPGAELDYKLYESFAPTTEQAEEPKTEPIAPMEKASATDSQMPENFKPVSADVAVQLPESVVRDEQETSTNLADKPDEGEKADLLTGAVGLSKANEVPATVPHTSEVLTVSEVPVEV